MSNSLKEQLASTPLFGGNSSAVESLYEQYLLQPESVPDSWREYFEAMGDSSTEIAHSEIRDQLLQESRAGRTIGQVVRKSSGQAATSEIGRAHV